MTSKLECPLCNRLSCKSLIYSFKKSVTSDNKFINKDISYSFCRFCDYIFIDYDVRIKPEDFYKEEYSFLCDSDDVEPEIEGVKYSDYIVKLFSEYIVNESGKTFLDIGAGKGNLLDSFYKKHDRLNYTAVEPSNNAFKILDNKKYIKKRINSFFHESLFDGITFDYISLVEVLEHVPNPREFLLSVSKVMNNNSTLFIEVPNFSNHMSDLLTIDHISLFTESNLQILLNHSGFEIISKNIQNRVPMQFIVKLKLEDEETFIEPSKSSLILYDNAKLYLEKIINDALEIRAKPVAIYGQNILLDYLVGNNILDISNIDCIINDSKNYQGLNKWKNKVDIVSYEDFEKVYNTENVFLAMNNCYHNQILKKLSGRKVYGTFSSFQ